MSSSARPEVIIFPDVEDLLVTYLTAQFPVHGETGTVHVTVPNPRPERFVIVPRIGGPKASLVVDVPTVAVECWATTPADAYGLCQLVRGLIHALPGRVVDGVPFGPVSEFAGPGNLPDPESTQARYVLTVSIRTRGIAA